MNIQVQLCGMAILILLYIFYRSHKTLQLYAEKIFHRTICIAMLSLSLDILSLVGIYYKQQLPMIVVKGICKLYIITLIWLTVAALSYVLADLFQEQEHLRMTKKLGLTTFIQSILICVLPISVYDDGKAVYTYGAAVLCVYAFVGIYMVITLAVIGKFHKRINFRRALAVGLWQLIWLTAAMIQFFNNQYLIVGFASAIGILILFVVMENPEANIDRRVGCFNSYALSEYLKQMIVRKERYSALDITFFAADSFEELDADIDAVMRKVFYFINKQKGILAFKNYKAGLLIVGKDKERLQAAGYDVLARFPEGSAFRKEARLTLLTCTNEFDEVDELMNFFKYVRLEYPGEKGKVFLADETVVTKYKEHYVVEKKIRDALAEDRVEVFLQPIYSNMEKSFTSAEALVRIRERDGKLLSPGIFIPVAEESGQILDLGERVFEKVCEFLQTSKAIELGVHYIEVNLSVIQCERKDLAERLISIIEKYDVEPERINLEITETASISARTTLLENMKKLMEYGFTFSLDDFGKGESNLMYVVEMPVSIVKLDYDMSKAFFNIPKAKHVVKAVVSMAHSMGIQIVAEGIETKEEIDGMYQEGIDYIQGYYYAKPLPMESFLGFLQSQNVSYV